MTINVTWPNIYKLSGLVIAVVSIMIAAGSFITQRQFDYIDKRMDDRLSVYQSDQADIRRRLELLEARK